MVEGNLAWITIKNGRKILKKCCISNAVNVTGVDTIFESYGNHDEKCTDDM